MAISSWLKPDGCWWRTPAERQGCRADAMLRRYALAFLLLASGGIASAQEVAKDQALQHSIEQLRSAIGHWEVVTQFLRDDGSVAKAVTGSYEFAWTVPDRVVNGKSEIPELKQSSGILFYINAAKRKIEMVSVGADGKLWIMTGPLGGETRLSQEYKTASGSGRLRFTRSKVAPDSFESKMEYTEDGGLTWKPGNHQRFRRVSKAAKQD